MQYVTRDSIIAVAAKPRSIREIVVPELEGTVRVRAMTGLERERLEQALIGVKATDARARFAASTVCDHDGKLLFSEMDIPTLNALPWTALNAIKEASEEQSATRPEDIDALEKKSTPAT